MTETPEFKLDRLFDAPRDMVWRAWTDPDLVHRWYGPNIETVIHQYDLTPGGVWLNEMKMGNSSDYSKMVFQEVTPPAALVWHHSSTDSDWNIVSNPRMPDWPRVLLTAVLFEDRGSQTSVQFSQVPINATGAEIACFTSVMAGMAGGWGKGFGIIDDLLADMQAS